MDSSSGCDPRPDARSSRADGGRVASAWPPDARVPDRRFPRSLRLTARRQFLHVYQEGVRVSTPSFTAFAVANGLSHSRLGLTVTRRTGNAVERNRIKRILRDLYRVNRSALSVPMDVVVNGRAALLRRPRAAVERDFLRGCERLAARLRERC